MNAPIPDPVIFFLGALPARERAALSAALRSHRATRAWDPDGDALGLHSGQWERRASGRMERAK